MFQALLHHQLVQPKSQNTAVVKKGLPIIDTSREASAQGLLNSRQKNWLNGLPFDIYTENPVLYKYVNLKPNLFIFRSDEINKHRLLCQSMLPSIWPQGIIMIKQSSITCLMNVCLSLQLFSVYIYWLHFCTQNLNMVIFK